MQVFYKDCKDWPCKWSLCKLTFKCFSINFSKLGKLYDSGQNIKELFLNVYVLLLFYFNFVWKVQWNLSKPNQLWGDVSVRNKQLFGLYRLNYQRFPKLGLYLKFGLNSIPVYSGFGLDRFKQDSSLFRVWFR